MQKIIDQIINGYKEKFLSLTELQIRLFDELTLFNIAEIISLLPKDIKINFIDMLKDLISANNNGEEIILMYGGSFIIKDKKIYEQEELKKKKYIKEELLPAVETYFKENNL